LVEGLLQRLDMITAQEAKAGTFKAELTKDWMRLSIESIDDKIKFAMDVGRYSTSWPCSLAVCREGKHIGPSITLSTQQIDEIKTYVKSSGYKVEKSVILSSTLPPFLDISWED
jgi:hypothetical protein